MWERREERTDQRTGVNEVGQTGETSGGEKMELG